MKQVVFETKSLGNIGPKNSEAVAWMCSVKKVPGHATLLTKKFWHRCFPVNFAKFFKTSIFHHFQWLLLKFGIKCLTIENPLKIWIYFKNGMVPWVVVLSVPFRYDEYNIILQMIFVLTHFRPLFHLRIN